MLNGAFGLFNHGYVFLVFEDLIREDYLGVFSEQMEHFITHFISGINGKAAPFHRPYEENKDKQTQIFFQMLYRLYTKEWIAKCVSTVSCGETLVHRAVRNGLYSLVIEDLIHELGFDVDFYEPGARLTLIHSAIKFRTEDWSDGEKLKIGTLIGMSSNLLRRNKQGSNIVRCAKHCQGIGTPNYEFIVAEFCKHLIPRVIMREAMLSGFLARRTNLTRFQVKEIYKYIDIDENDVREDLV